MSSSLKENLVPMLHKHYSTQALPFKDIRNHQHSMTIERIPTVQSDHSNIQIKMNNTVAEEMSAKN